MLCYIIMVILQNYGHFSYISKHEVIPRGLDNSTVLLLRNLQLSKLASCEAEVDLTFPSIYTPKDSSVKHKVTCIKILCYDLFLPKVLGKV